MKKAGLSPAFLWALCSDARFRVEFGDVVPVHDLPPGVEVVGTFVLVVEVVGVFPYVAAEDGRALDGGGVHQWVVLVRGAGDGEFAVFAGVHAAVVVVDAELGAEAGVGVKWGVVGVHGVPCLG